MAARRKTARTAERVNRKTADEKNRGPEGFLTAEEGELEPRTGRLTFSTAEFADEGESDFSTAEDGESEPRTGRPDISTAKDAEFAERTMWQTPIAAHQARGTAIWT